MGMTVMAPGEGLVGEAAEMVGSRQPGVEEMDAYERVLGDAMGGDATLFAREDYVEEAWRIVDPVLTKGTPVFTYDPGTWGPKEVERVTRRLEGGRTRLWRRHSYETSDFRGRRIDRPRSSGNDRGGSSRRR